MTPARLSLSTAQTHALLDGTVALTCLLTLAVVLPAARRPPPDPAEPASGGALRPWAGFVLVCALLLANQLLVQAYILATHGGDPGFVCRYLGRGWFAGAPHAPPVRWLAANLPSAWLAGPLSYSLLRVQAVLELPFALLAYLSVAALIDPALGRRLARSALLPLAAVSFTFTFCLIELRLYNPWTTSDLWARWLSATAVVGLWLADRAGRTPRTAALMPPLATPPLGLWGVLRFFLGAAAVGALVLCMYDVALLYNIGHLGRRLPIVLAALGTGTLAAWPGGRAPAAYRGAPPGPALQGLTSFLAVFTTLFFAPSLSIRYCGDRPSALGAAAALGLLGLGLGAGLIGRTLAARGVPRWRGLAGLAVALVVGELLLLAEVPRRVFGSAPLLELSLLEAAALLLPCITAALWAVDQLLTRRPPPTGNTAEGKLPP